jgi:release factor glutamine methyltransferase
MSAQTPMPRNETRSIATLVGWAAAELAAAELAAAELAAAAPGARLEAELLLGAATGLGRAALIAHGEREVVAPVAATFEAAVRRRARGEPLAYLLGTREFYSLPLEVTPAVLVPRPATETLVEQALARLPSRAGATVLDLGTGSGAIALAIKRQRPDARVTAVDRDPDALAVARANAACLKLELSLLESDWFAALGAARFDIVVANPPYVASDDPHFAGPLRFEPRLALDGGPDGLDAVRAIVGAASAHLEAGGRLLVEHGYDQRAALGEIAATAALRVVGLYDDFEGLPRVAVLEVG